MAVVGGLLGVGLAWWLVNPDFLQVGAFIPVFGVHYQNVVMALGLSLLIGVLAGLIPATMAARLRIVDALRRVA